MQAVFKSSFDLWIFRSDWRAISRRTFWGFAARNDGPLLAYKWCFIEEATGNQVNAKESPDAPVAMLATFANAMRTEL